MQKDVLTATPPKKGVRILQSSRKHKAEAGPTLACCALSSHCLGPSPLGWQRTTRGSISKFEGYTLSKCITPVSTMHRNARFHEALLLSPLLCLSTVPTILAYTAPDNHSRHCARRNPTSDCAKGLQSSKRGRESLPASSTLRLSCGANKLYPTARRRPTFPTRQTDGLEEGIGSETRNAQPMPSPPSPNAGRLCCCTSERHRKILRAYCRRRCPRSQSTRSESVSHRH